MNDLKELLDQMELLAESWEIGWVELALNPQRAPQELREMAERFRERLRGKQ